MLGFSRKTIVVFLCIAALLVFAVIAGYARFLPEAVTSVTAPVFKAAGNLTGKVGTWFGNIFQLAEQVQKSAELQREVRKLQAQLAEAEFAKTENDQLRALLNLQQRIDYQLIAATSVNEDPTRTSLLVTLDRGSTSGVNTGAAVLDTSGNLLGIVSEVSTHSAKFLLLTDRSSRVDVAILPGNALGVAIGRHGVGVEVDFLQQETEISAQQTLVTAGLTRGIPAGIPVGLVDEVVSTQADLFKRVSIIPFADMRNFRLVAVIKH